MITQAQEQENSIIPSIREIEKFIQYLNNRFKLGLNSNIIVTIEQKSHKLKGYFMPIQKGFSYENETEVLNTITLNSIYLKNNPYETIAHETAHFFNSINDIKDYSNQYHNKHFKIVAEKLLLKVTKTNKGFSQTEETDEFKLMLNDFKTDKNAFNIFQNHRDKEKIKSRNLLYKCSCGCKIRTAKNEEKPLKAKCLYCDSFFICDELKEETDENKLKLNLN
jgi:ferredoxin-like protein FixX